MNKEITEIVDNNDMTRRIFYVDIGNMSQDEALEHIERIKQDMIDRRGNNQPPQR